MEQQVGTGVTWKVAGQIAVQLIRLLTVAALARFLTPADYGTAAIAIVLASFAPTLADMGIGSALVQAKEAPRTVRSTAFWASIGFGIGMFLLMAAAANPIGQFLGEPRAGEMVAAGGLAFAIYAVGSTSQAMYVRRMRFRSIELRNWLGLVVGAVVAVTAAALGAGPWALVLQQVVYQGSFVIALWWRPGWRPTLDFSRPVFRELVSFAIRIAGGRWARMIELLVLSLLIGKLVSVHDLGAWSFGLSMVILPLSLVVIPIAEVLFSAFSRLRDQPDRVSVLWLDSIAYLAAVLLPLLIGLVIVSPDLIPVVFGSRWEVSVGVVQIPSG
jgi:O-antigen/teichoic acid export membrane protein